MALAQAISIRVGLFRPNVKRQPRHRPQRLLPFRLLQQRRLLRDDLFRQARNPQVRQLPLGLLFQRELLRSVAVIFLQLPRMR